MKTRNWVASSCLAVLASILLLSGTSQMTTADNVGEQGANTPVGVDRLNAISDKYLSYTAWYEPKYYLDAQGKYQANPGVDAKDGVQHWFPIIAYTWPNKGVQANYIKYLVAHGYSDTRLGLTKAKTQILTSTTPTAILNNYSRLLRIAYIKKGIDQLDSTVKAFVKQEAFFSELPVEARRGYVPAASGSVDDDQFLFINNNQTSQANSQYRKLTNNLSGEFLLGNDIDNSNPTVQAENLNWEYYLLKHLNGKASSDANFDGFRVDAAAHVDQTALTQLNTLMNQLYDRQHSERNANDHLLYNETYTKKAIKAWKQDHNNALYMDFPLYNAFRSTLGAKVGKRSNLYSLATAGVVDRRNDQTENQAHPNWSFVSNHDTFKNIINRMIINRHKHDKYIMSDHYRAADANWAWQVYQKDRASTNKKYALYNIPAQYALELTNKDTIPTVYYGDLYNDFGSYMASKTPYYSVISALMHARKRYIAGGQRISKLTKAGDVIASVRYGKGVNNATTKASDTLAKKSGAAIVVSNNPTLKSRNVTIALGKTHANQKYSYLLHSWTKGISINSKSTTFKTDSKGNLRLKVKGYRNPLVSGYLAVLVPQAAATDQVATSSASSAATKDQTTFHSNAALDSHLIYEDFSLFQKDGEHDTYTKIKDNAKNFANAGITDFWMAPAYRSFGMSRYNEGYAIADRYDLGDGNPTKYGTRDQLTSAIAALHQAGLKVQADLVLNQMLGFLEVEAVTVNRTNADGKLISVNGKTIKSSVYFAYTKTGKSNEQTDFGGKYLDELSQALAGTSAASVVKNVPRISQWRAEYENGTSLQNQGANLAVQVTPGKIATVGTDLQKSTLPANLRDDVKLTTGIVNTPKHAYYLAATGQLQTGFQKIGKTTYYFSKTYGYRLTGTRRIGKYSYYFGNKTGAMKTGFQRIGRYTYYYTKQQGRKLYGRHVIGKKTYMFDRRTGRLLSRKG
ncbi:MAG: glycoside hydrolase family 70 protein [Lactobacillus sp.]